MYHYFVIAYQTLYRLIDSISIVHKLYNIHDPSILFTTLSSGIQNGLPVDRENLRPILKDEKKAEPKPLKRVWFDPYIAYNMEKKASGPGEENTRFATSAASA